MPQRKQEKCEFGEIALIQYLEQVKLHQNRFALRSNEGETAMPEIKRSDLRYPYNWTASVGDNPKLIADDKNHLSRKEGYEMLLYLNSLQGGRGEDLSVHMRQIVEWMLKEHFDSTAPSRETVTQWVAANYERLSPHYPG